LVSWFAPAHRLQAWTSSGPCSARTCRAGITCRPKQRAS
jgi:hypothetical protein